MAHLADGGEKIDRKTTESAVASTVVTAEEHLQIIIANNNEHNVDICTWLTHHNIWGPFSCNNYYSDYENYNNDDDIKICKWSPNHNIGRLLSRNHHQVWNPCTVEGFK